MNADDGGRIEVVRETRDGAGSSTGGGGLVVRVTVDNKAKLNVLGSRLTRELSSIRWFRHCRFRSRRKAQGQGGHDG